MQNPNESWLFPALEDELGALDDKHRQFVAVCELCAPQDHMAAYRWCGNGCPPSDRLALCKAFIAKAVWDFATTRNLFAGESGRFANGLRLGLQEEQPEQEGVLARLQAAYGSTPICTTSTADGMCACACLRAYTHRQAARSRSPPTWPSDWS